MIRTPTARWFNRTDKEGDYNPRVRQIPIDRIWSVQGWDFLSIPKCASQAMKLALSRDFYAVPRHEARAKRSFSICRNPFERAVSIWYATCVREDKSRTFSGWRRQCKNFSECLGLIMTDHKYFGTQVEMLNHWYDRKPEQVTEWLCLESIDEDFARLPFVPDKYQLPIFNTTLEEREPWPSYYTPLERDLVLSWASQDFKAFGYATELP